MIEAGFQHAVTRPVELIHQTYIGEDVFNDPFLVRTSTSQLQLISEEHYVEGKKKIVSQIERAKAGNHHVAFDVNLVLFCTIGK
jgi:hypothetical protein